jgi:hypothetical protein
MPMSSEVREVLDTCRVVAQLGTACLGAYVISMARGASDVLAVELLQREALFQVCVCVCVCVCGWVGGRVGVKVAVSHACAGRLCVRGLGG